MGWRRKPEGTFSGNAQTQRGCRKSQEAGTSHQLQAPEGMERELGLPLKDPEVEEWRSAWTAPPREPASAWRAGHLYVDASCKQPKLASIRTVGWAVVDGKGHTRGGVLPPGSTVALGEARAILEAYEQCETGSVIYLVGLPGGGEALEAMSAPECKAVRRGAARDVACFCGS